MFNPLQSRTLNVACKALPTWGGADVLIAQRVSGVEALGKLFKYTVEFATLDSPTFRIYKARELIKPDELIGKTIEISIEFEGKGAFIPGLPGNLGAGNVGAGVRTINGIITEVRQTGSDERRAYYQFTVRPWLWLASKNRDSRVFQDMNVLQVTEAVLKSGNYKFPWQMRLAAVSLNNNVFPPRDFIRQFWQSDFEFLSQIWSEWGIYYHFDGMTLVLCDSPGSHKKHANAYDTVLYHAPEGKRIDEEHIYALSVARKITAGEITLNDYDYTRSNGRFDMNQSRYSEASFDNAAQYHWGDYTQPMAGAMGLDGKPNDLRNEGDYLARVRVEALRCEGLRLHGTGNLRGLTTGRKFRLEGHPQKELNTRYLVVSTSIDVRNPDELTVTAGSDAQYHCKTDFVVQPDDTFFKTMPREKPRAHPESAVVVGPENQPIWLDGYARTRVQFKWDRLGKLDQNSSCWVRVSQPWHGGPHSFIAVPRIGDEVTIGYHEGDPDKPFIMASKVNQFNPPPFELPRNMALTGLVSHALEEQGHNYVVTDDTPGQQQVQVASDQANSRLVLGYNTRIEYRAGRQQARGLGWELATDAWGVLRANRGMLITTETRAGARAAAMDMGETLQRLARANEQQDVLAHSAVQARAQDPQHQLDLTQALRTQVSELQNSKPWDATDMSGPRKPHLLVASSADIAQTAAHNVNVHSGAHTAITAGGHFAASSGGDLLASARKAIRFFAYKLGMRLVSYAEDIDIQALKKSINLLAKLEITQTANRITIKASEEVMIHGGDSYISLKSGKITVGGGVYEVNARAKNLPSKPMGVSPQGLPDVQANDQMFRVLSPGGKPLPGVDYAMQTASGGHVFRTGEKGESPLVNTEQAEDVKFELHWDEFASASGRAIHPGTPQ
ncbi:type VI secretion system tip protein VgrG [Caballeronia novacaledonica]|uniref:Type VI secretion system tip protein VgrG n=1 Tax=Caballeronia novacaledonica TaxID=1544861 RepID=A0ACB5R105_9BURK|nr:type VI secretion system tip protein VgrG [Caballeronia novacaledonica]